MEDTFTPFIKELVASLKNAETSLNGIVVKDSQQITGDKQEPSLRKRISPDKHGAEIQRRLEETKAGIPTNEDTEHADEMSNKIAEKYADEIIAKFFEVLNG